jgi:hypothetical protein
MTAMPEKKRGELLTVWLILMLLANVGTALAYLLIGVFTAAIVPSVPLWASYTFAIFALLNVIFIIFLFMRKKWAFFALCGSAGAAFIINLAIGVDPFSVVGLLGLPVLYLILRPKWALLE